MIRILIITNKEDLTTDFVVKKLREKKASFYRLNTEDIGGNVLLDFRPKSNEFTLFDTISKIQINLLKIKSVYFRRPEIMSTHSNLTAGENNFIKSEILYTLEGLYRILDKAFWLNNIYDIRNAENKIYQQILANAIGLETPNSIITNKPHSALDFSNTYSKDCIIKPIKSGLVEGTEEEGVIFTNKISIDEQNHERVRHCPIYLQNEIKKKADIRVTIVNNEVFAVQIHSQVSPETEVDWRKGNYLLKHTLIRLPNKIKSKCLELTKMFKLNFAAIDFILDTESRFIFLEVNPNGQWAWIEKQTMAPISETITNILIEKSI